MTWWFLARGAGFMAVIGATAAVCLGVSATSARGGPRLMRQLAHRSAAVVTLALLAMHALLLITDRFVSLSLPGALVPFTAGYRGVALGIGTLAMYCLLVVALTGAFRGRFASSARATRWWRPVHALAYAAWPLCIIHGVFAGTDTATWWAWTLYGGCTLAVAIAVWLRLAAEDAHDATPLAIARRRLHSAGSRP